MYYKEYRPSTFLQPYIETYWSTEGFNNQIIKEKILPDGCVDIIFSFGDSCDGLISFLPNVVGTMTTYSKVYFRNEVSMLGIRFRPTGISAFIKTPIYEFTNQQLAITLTDSILDENFYLKMLELNSIEEKIIHLDYYLIRKLQYIYEPDKQISYSIDFIRKTNGRESLSNIATNSCLSLRHFERRFKNAVGISPKIFCKIERFKHAISYLQLNKNTDLLTTAINCGYYDQSHLIKDFRSLSGNSPSFYKRK